MAAVDEVEVEVSAVESAMVDRSSRSFRMYPRALLLVCGWSLC